MLRYLWILKLTSDIISVDFDYIQLFPKKRRQFGERKFWSQENYFESGIESKLHFLYCSICYRKTISPSKNCLWECLKIKIRIWHLLKCSFLLRRLTKGQREPPIDVSISEKSMMVFEGLWVHNNFWNFFGPEVSFENYLKICF